jgi:hypothetical protein
MLADDLIDAIQTAALIVTAGAQIYTMLLLRNEMREAARALGRVGRRLEKIEATIGLQSSASDDNEV